MCAGWREPTGRVHCPALAVTVLRPMGTTEGQCQVQRTALRGGVTSVEGHSDPGSESGR